MRDLTHQVSTGERRRELEGHTARVYSLGVAGSRLASGSYDGSIRVWPAGAGAEWPCARTVTVHTHTRWHRLRSGRGGSSAVRRTRPFACGGSRRGGRTPASPATQAPFMAVRADRDSAHTLGARDGGAGRHPHRPQRPCLWAAGARGATVQRVVGREHPGMGGGEAGGGGEGGGVRR